MSDLRLEDLRALDPVPINRCGETECCYCDADDALYAERGTRRVSRREVLEALGAKKRWRCVFVNPDIECEYPDDAMDDPDHARCSWVWVVVDDAT